MINATNFIDAIVYGRYYKFRTDKGLYLVYESLHEEGPDVKKKVTQFSKEKDALAFIAKMQEMLRTYLQSAFVVKPSAIANELQMPTAKDVLNELDKEETIRKVDSKRAENSNPGENSAF